MRLTEDKDSTAAFKMIVFIVSAVTISLFAGLYMLNSAQSQPHQTQQAATQAHSL